ncbi:MAG: hypothetical protein ACYTGW_07160 [Planctomycetota bacterium]|jgi:hypothetical protein
MGSAIKTTQLALLVLFSTIAFAAALQGQDEGKKLSIIEKAPGAVAQMRRY